MGGVTRPTARVLALLEILQAGGTRTVAELAERLAVDERTVRRYVGPPRRPGHPGPLGARPLRRLPARPGLPHAAADAHRRGGPRRAAGPARLPPVRTATTSAVAAESAAAKLRRVLPAALAARLRAAARHDRRLHRGPAARGRHPGGRRAATPRPGRAGPPPVAIGYVDRDGRRSDRTLHPYGIVAHAARWYVTGADSASGEVRLFRLDRVTTPTVLTGSFDVPPDFDPAARVLAALAEAPYRHEVAVRVHGTVDEVRPLLPAVRRRRRRHARRLLGPGPASGPSASTGSRPCSSAWGGGSSSSTPRSSGCSCASWATGCSRRPITRRPRRRRAV